MAKRIMIERVAGHERMEFSGFKKMKKTDYNKPPENWSSFRLPAFLEPFRKYFVFQNGQAKASIPIGRKEALYIINHSNPDFLDNRKQKKNNITRISIDMINDDFDANNGETMSFFVDTQGWALTNGQHRMEAMIVATEDLENRDIAYYFSVVVLYLDKKVMEKMDLGVHRNLGDILSVNKIVSKYDAPHIAAAAGVIMKYERFGLQGSYITKGKTITRTEVITFVKKNAQILTQNAATIFSYYKDKTAQKILVPSSAIAAYYLYQKWNKSKEKDIKVFFEKLYLGVFEKSDPARYLSNRLNEYARDKSVDLKKGIRFGMLLKTMNSHLAKEEQNGYKFLRVKQGDNVIVRGSNYEWSDKLF